jgi:glycosyltransferase involved in cell wall biosynthesis
MPKSTQLKIAILSDAIPERNGAGSYYFDLIENLQEYVEHIELISPGPEKRWQGWFDMPLPGDATQHIAIPAFKIIRTHLDRVKPDVIIAATPGPFGLYGKRLAKRYRAKYFVGYHTSFEKLTRLFWNPVQAFLIKRYFIMMNHMLFKTADVVVANSEEMLENARKYDAPKTRLIGTPLPHNYISRPLSNSPGGIDNILFAGRLSAEKNIEGLLNTAEQLGSLRFSIAGDGPLRGDIEAYSDNHSNLAYYGWKERDELLEIIDEHDLLVLPSHVESFGTIALEAMARGRIVLVSENCGIVNWPDLKQGLYHYSEDEGLSAAIQRIASLDTDELREAGERARSAAIALNNWNIDDWLSILIHEY